MIVVAGRDLGKPAHGAVGQLDAALTRS